jgi:hypothetical protein
VRAVCVVLGAVDAEQLLKVAVAGDQGAVEAVAAAGADPSFRVGVRVRRLAGRLDQLASFAADDRVEVAAERAVAVVDEEAKRLCLVVEGDQQVPRVLARPRAVAVARRSDRLEPASLQ